MCFHESNSYSHFFAFLLPNCKILLMKTSISQFQLPHPWLYKYIVLIETVTFLWRKEIFWNNPRRIFTLRFLYINVLPGTFRLSMLFSFSWDIKCDRNYFSVSLMHSINYYAVLIIHDGYNHVVMYGDQKTSLSDQIMVWMKANKPLEYDIHYQT